MTTRAAEEDDAGMTSQLSVPFGEAHVSDVMTPGVISCGPETPLRTVARMMATYRVHAVVVFDDADWRIVSDLDLVASASAADDRTAGAVSASPLITVTPDETLERTAQLMAEHETAHVIVRDAGADRPLGVVSTLDIARALAFEQLRREAGLVD